MLQKTNQPTSQLKTAHGTNSLSTLPKALPPGNLPRNSVRTTAYGSSSRTLHPLLYIKNVRLTTENGGSSAIEDVVTDKAGALKAAGLNGAIAVEAAGAFTVYNLAGVAVAAGEGVQTVEVEAGLYVVVADKAAQKVVVK